jgi:hypothetical protein
MDFKQQIFITNAMIFRTHWSSSNHKKMEVNKDKYSEAIQLNNGMVVINMEVNIKKMLRLLFFLFLNSKNLTSNLKTQMQ